MISQKIAQQIRVLYRPKDAFHTMKADSFSSALISCAVLLIINSVLASIFP